MPDPVPIVEVEFTPGVWTPISAHLRSGNTKRGRSKAIEKIAPGRMTLVLSNQGRLFDPEYAANISPGNLVEDKKIRLKATYNAITYDIFTGYIDRIVQRYNAPNDAVAIIECSDGLARLAQDELPSAYSAIMRNYSPRVWYRLGEKEGPSAWDWSGNSYNATYGGAPVFGEDGFVDRDDDTAVKFPGNYLGWLYIPPGALPPALPWTIGFTFLVPALPPPGGKSFILWELSYPQGLAVWLDDAGRINVEVRRGGTYTYVRTSAAWGAFVGNPYTIHIRASAGVPLRIQHHFNLISDVATAVGTGGVLASWYGAVLGHSLTDVTFDEFQAYDSLLPDADIQEQAFAAQAWANDSAYNRIARLLDLVKWPAADRYNLEPEGPLLRGTDLNMSVLSHLEQIVTSAEARMFVRTDGKLWIMGKQEHAQVHKLSQGTFGDGPGELGYVEMGDYAIDANTIENIIRRRWKSNYDDRESVIEVSAPANRQRIGAEIESQFLSPEAEYDLATYRLAHTSVPTPYVEGLKIPPRKDPNTLFPQVLGRELGDRVTWKRRPQGIGNPISREVIIEGISHSFAPKRWDTDFFIDATDAQRYFLFDYTLWDSGDWRFIA